MPNDYFNPPNSIWPNGLKKDDEGYAVFYPLGTNKVDISTVTWPEGDKLISPFVYQDDRLVGFIDTEALTVSGSTTTTMNYNYIKANFASIEEGTLTIDAPNATVKEFKWAVTAGGDVVNFKYKGCKTVDDVKAVDSDYLTNDVVDGVWSQSLADLTDGGNMFSNCDNLILFSADLSSLTYGGYMFYSCDNLTSFSSDLSSLTNGKHMFYICANLTTFTSDLSSLTDSLSMFYGCSNLTTFTSNLSSLTSGRGMFTRCKLDTASVQNIADTINTYNELIHIDIGNSSPNEQEDAAFNKIASKGWTVFANSFTYTPTSPATITTLDENGEERITPIPFYAKPVEATEENAEYVDEQGNFFNIVGAQFIYGDDISTYGMFTCEADAAANMRLTKIEKGDK